MPNYEFRFAIGLVGPLLPFEGEPILGDEVERPFGDPFACGRFRPAVLDGISTLSYEAPSDHGRLARVDERNLRVGAEAEKVFLPSARAAIAEQPSLAPVRPDAQSEPIPVGEQIGALARFGDAKDHLGLRFDAFRHDPATRFRVYASVYAKIVDATGT
ncbi:hypothetical protein OKW43_004287 [Paraburkholderia sp. WC7.3g]